MCLGLVASVFIGANTPFLACFLLLLSGYFDTLDGSFARYTNNTTAIGSACDILADRIVEFVIVLGFYLLDPTRAIFCILMLGSILICVTSFLVVGIFTENNSQKNFHYSPGLMERSEAFIFFAFMILFPTFFYPLAGLFTLLVLWTGLYRIKQFAKNSLDYDASQTSESN